MFIDYRPKQNHFSVRRSGTKLGWDGATWLPLLRTEKILNNSDRCYKHLTRKRVNSGCETLVCRFRLLAPLHWLRLPIYNSVGIGQTPEASGSPLLNGSK